MYILYIFSCMKLVKEERKSQYEPSLPLFFSFFLFFFFSNSIFTLGLSHSIPGCNLIIIQATRTKILNVTRDRLVTGAGC